MTATMAADRAVPQNIDAEQALLGAILLDNNVIDRVGSLAPAHFAKESHQRIFALSRDLVTGGRIADPTTLEARLPADLEGNTRRYIDRLIGEATTSLNAAEYGRLIYELAVKRNLISLGEELIDQCYDPTVTLAPTEQIEQAEQRLYAIAETGRYDRGFMSFAEAATASIEMVSNAYQRDGHLSGLATGLIDLDGKLGGLQASDLVILAGRPGMGKTALATDIAVDVALRQQQPVGFFSLEMSGEQLATRVLAEKTSIASSAMRRGTIQPEDFDRIRDVAVELENIPLYIDEAGGLTVNQIAARARRLKRQRGLSLLVIDYLQLMHGSRQRRNENRVQELTEITTTLKALAKELDAPILALSQLSRLVESRENKRPQLSDLRESGSIEQDADVVMFLYREEYYIQMSKPSESDTAKYGQWLADMERVKNKAEVIIGKQRHGPTGTVDLQFSPEFTRFSNLQ